MSETSSTRNNEKNNEKPSAWSDAPPSNSPLFWLACLLVLKLVAPFVPIPNYSVAVITSALFTVAYVVTVVMFVAQLLRRPMTLVQRIALLAMALCLWSAFSFAAAPLLGDAFKAANGQADATLRALANVVSVGTDVSLLCAAALGGSLVAQMISSPNLLGPLCGLLAMLDVWFVLFQGIASQMIKDAPGYVDKVTAAAPAVGAAARSNFAISPVGIGAADYLFLGFFFAIMHRFGMNWRTSTKLIIVLVCGALLAVMAGIGHLPGLLFIGLGAALPNLKFFEYSKEEKLALMQAGGFVVLMTIGLYFAQPFIIARMQQVK
jgi:hypothetical protein